MADDLWMQKPWWLQDDGSPNLVTGFVSGLRSGYQAGQQAKERRSLNKGIDAHNESVSALGKAGMIPQSTVEGSTMSRIPGNAIMDILGASVGMGSEENFMNPQQRAAYSLQRQNFESEAGFRLNSMVNQNAMTRLNREKFQAEQELRLLTEGAAVSLMDTYNDLVKNGKMGTEEAVMSLNEVIVKNPFLADHPATRFALKSAEDAFARNGPVKTEVIDGEEFFRQPNTGALTRVHPSGQTIEAYGPDGQLISRVSSGRGSQKDPNAPTIATQTDVQKQALAGESAVTTGITLLNSLSPDMVGARGFFNEVVINEGLAQIFPEKAKDEVSSGRSLMRAFNERVIKSIKADSQLNASERKALESALPQFGVGESLPSAKAKIGTFIEEARKVTRINSVRTNKPIPDWAWSREEIVDKFKKGEINESKARELLKTYHYKVE